MKSLAGAFALLLGGAVAFAPGTAMATNGLWMIGFGSKSRGMGGVGFSYGQDGLAAAANPATMVDVSTRFDIGAELFHAPLAVNHNGNPIDVDNAETRKTGIGLAEDLYLIPNFGGVKALGDTSVGPLNFPDLTLGLSVIGAGLGTNYKQGPQNSDTNFFNVVPGENDDDLGVEVLQMQFLPSAAWRIGDHNSFGASVAVGAQAFRARGLEDFDSLGYSKYPNSLTGNGWDFSYGAGLRLGWQGNYLKDRLRIGVTAASRVYMTRFHEYKGLFANKGEFDIPPFLGAGITFRPMETVTASFDVQRIFWSEVDSIGRSGPTVDRFEPEGCEKYSSPLTVSECQLGGDKGWGFGWTNQTVYKLGVDYDPRWSLFGASFKPLTVRAGFNYAEAPIPEDQVLFNMLAPATVEEHVTVGGTYRISKGYEISANYMHAFKNTIKGPTAFPEGGSGRGSIAMRQNSLGVSLGLKY